MFRRSVGPFVAALSVVALLTAAQPALAGYVTWLVYPFDIGKAQSLPWHRVVAWPDRLRSREPHPGYRRASDTFHADHHSARDATAGSDLRERGPSHSRAAVADVHGRGWNER